MTLLYLLLIIFTKVLVTIC